MTAARRGAAEPFAGNEGLTDDLADGEAGALLRWLNAAAKKRLATARDQAAAQAVLADLRARAKLLGAALAARCYDADAKAAQTAFAALGLPHRLDDLPAADPAAALQKLLQWEEARHA